MTHIQSRLAQLAAAWAGQPYPHAAPATAGQIAAFESRHNVHLPDDLRAYVTTLNGGDLGRDAMDNEFIAFWRLDQICTQQEEGIGHRVDLFLFADFLIHSHFYAIELHSDPGAPTPVFIDHVGTVVKVADSFDEFLLGYLRGDEDVLFANGTTTRGPSA